jgi:hypothetical protein
MKKVCTLALACMALYAQEEIAMSKCSREPKDQNMQQNKQNGAPDDGPEDKEATQAPGQPKMAPPAYRLPAEKAKVAPKARPGAAKNAMSKEQAIKR